MKKSSAAAAAAALEALAGAPKARTPKSALPKPIIDGHEPDVDAWVEAKREAESWAGVEAERKLTLLQPVYAAFRERLVRGDLVQSYVLHGTAASPRATVRSSARPRSIEVEAAMRAAGLVGVLYDVGPTASSAGRLLDMIVESAKASPDVRRLLDAARAAGIVVDAMIPRDKFLQRAATFIPSCAPAVREVVAERVCEWVDSPAFSDKDFDPEANGGRP